MASDPPDIRIDEHRLRAIEEKIARLARAVHNAQNFPGALIGGVLGVVVGVLLWALVASWARQTAPWMALGVGAVCGLAVRWLGHGIDLRFGLLSAICSIAGCLAGSLLAGAVVVAQNLDLSLLDLTATPNQHVAAAVVKMALDWMLAIFSVVSAYLSFRLAFRSLSPEESAALLQPGSSPNLPAAT